MGTDEKFDSMKDRVSGRTKETVGAATDDDDLRAEGKNEQAKGDLKNAGEKVKDAADNVKDAFRR